MLLSTINPFLVAESEFRCCGSAGQIQPLPTVVFPIQEAPDALRQLSAAKHIGKVVVRVPSALPMPEQAPGRWIISGGLGALGSLSVQWLVRQGMLCMQTIQKHACSHHCLH